MKKLIVILVALALALPAAAVVTKATLINTDGDKVVVNSGSAEAQKLFSKGFVLLGSPFKTETKVEKVCDCSKVGAMPGGDVFTDLNVYGALKSKIATKVISPATVFSTTTLSVMDSGTNLILTGKGARITLPTRTATGTIFRFTVGASFGTANYVIATNETTNINGTLIVAGAVVDCRGETYINFIADGEEVGDYVELMSIGGAGWVIVDSGSLTASKLTCTTS